MKRAGFVAAVIAGLAVTCLGKVDLVTLPSRQSVQLTIYNSADLTLVRERRVLTLEQGINRLQFSWANTLIDPTSLEMVAKRYVDKIDVADLTYPARVRNVGLWHIRSEVAGEVPVEITYLTSGLSWRAFYIGTLSADEKKMDLQGYVRVSNNSGEDYEDAQTRLIVGRIHILDQIAELARRQYPYGRPGQVVRGVALGRGLAAGMKEEFYMAEAAAAPAAKRSEIKKEGLSEYFLYTIEGTETIPTGWSKRLVSFEASSVEVVNLYKYEQERYGRSVVRFLRFRNDTAHHLGQTPIPGGLLRVYRSVDRAGHLSYVGQSSFKYIPVGEEVELNLGTVEDVLVRPKLMGYKTENYLFDRKGEISGWDEIRQFELEVRNTRDVPVRVEIKRNFDSPYWRIDRWGQYGQFEKVDLDTVKFTLELEPRSIKRFGYTLRTYHGTRQEQWRKEPQQ